MNEHRLALFLGKPIRLENGLEIHSPKINEIHEIGENMHSIHVVLGSFDKQRILSSLLGMDEEKMGLFADQDAFDLFCKDENLCEGIANAISFFAKASVTFSLEHQVFMHGDIPFVSKENYKEVAQCIRVANGHSEKPEDRMKPKNSKAQALMEQMKKIQQQLSEKATQKEGTMDLKDILSTLCNVEGNGINIFNCADLTLYQVYEHFERTQLKESHKRLLPVWANGHLGSDKLPEWIKTTTF